jgi:hypothetical protein
MGLAAIVRKGVAIANSVTNDLQVDVTHEAFSGVGTYGEPTFSAAVTRSALVEIEPKMVRTAAGDEAVSRATISIIGDVTVNNRDRFTLPDGSTGPILNVSGFLDPLTGRGYLTQVYLG